MRIERYMREYFYDEDDNNYGLFLSNDGYHLSGDVNLPGFKPYDIDPAYVDKILQMAEVEFDMWGKDDPKYRYAIHGLRQLLLGRKSDWKITLVEPSPRHICLYLKNRKIAKVQVLLDKLDTGENLDPAQIATLDFGDNALGNWVIINLVPQDGEYCHLKLRLKRKKDSKEEVDFYDISAYGQTATIIETHRISCSRREINLRFSDKVDKYDNAEAMIGEIEEVE